MNQDKIQALAKTPRNLSDADKTAICAKPFFFLFGAVKRWEEAMVNGPVVYAVVVQANECLYSAAEAEWAPAVLLYTKDPRHALDGAWLRELAQRINHLKDEYVTDRECQVLVANLYAETTHIEQLVPMSLTGGVEVQMCSLHLDPKLIPGGYLKEDTLMAGLLIGGDDINLLPVNMYA